MLTNSKELTDVVLPPYGVMTDGLQQELDQFPEIPPHFLPLCGSSLSRKEDWKRLRDSLQEIIAKTLWPMWDPQQMQWENPDHGHMVRITHTDLDHIARFRTTALNETPESPVRSADCPSHEVFYRSEDDNDWFAQYAFYDSTISRDLIERFSNLFNTVAPEKHGTVHLQFKQVFQRPRAFQTVFLLRRPTVKPLQAISAGSPSLCSGHALEAALGIGAVMEFLLLRETNLSPGSWEALRQHTVDIGDRRVFAGIHYPSDNLASWIIALTLANHLYRTPQVKAHLWRAISIQSRVFQSIKDEPVYADAVRELRKAAEDVDEASRALQ